MPVRIDDDYDDDAGYDDDDAYYDNKYIYAYYKNMPMIMHITIRIIMRSVMPII